MPLLPFLRVDPLEEQDTSYLAASVKILTLSRVLSLIIDTMYDKKIK
jgi:hypothetical protein